MTDRLPTPQEYYLALFEDFMRRHPNRTMGQIHALTCRHYEQEKGLRSPFQYYTSLVRGRTRHARQEMKAARTKTENPIQP